MRPALILDHFQRFVVGPASLSVVSYTDRRPFMVRLNDGGADLSCLIPPAPLLTGDAIVGGGSGSCSPDSLDAGSTNAGSTD